MRMKITFYAPGRRNKSNSRRKTESSRFDKKKKKIKKLSRGRRRRYKPNALNEVNLCTN